LKFSVQLLAIYYVLLYVQPAHRGVAWLPVDAVRTGKASTSIQLSPEAVAELGRGVQKRRANQGLQQQSQGGGGGNLNQGDCRGTRDYSHRAAAKVAIKATRVIVRKTKAVSMAKMALGPSLPAQWAINSKLEQTKETPRSSSEGVYRLLSSMLSIMREKGSPFLSKGPCPRSVEGVSFLSGIPDVMSRASVLSLGCKSPFLLFRSLSTQRVCRSMFLQRLFVKG